MSDLILACAYGCISDVGKILKTMSVENDYIEQVNSADENGITPLVATVVGETLLEFTGMKLDVKGFSQCLIKLLDSKVIDIDKKCKGMTPLVHSIIKEHFLISTMLIDNGASLTIESNGFLPIDFAALVGNFYIFKYIHDRNQNTTINTVCCACFSGNSEIYNFLVNKNKNIIFEKGLIPLPDYNNPKFPVEYAVINRNDELLNIINKNL
jgi:ankyrin repeat protein